MAISMVMSRSTEISKWTWFLMTTNSWTTNFFYETYDRSTSMNNVAMRSDCSSALPSVVLEVTKKVRVPDFIASGAEFLEGFDISRG